jgi:small multidrug resistance pump
MHWLYLWLAIFLEILGTVCTRLADGFTRPLPSAGVVVFYVLSLGIFTLTVKKIDVGVAYAIWSGVGTAAIAIIGFLAFKEPVTTAKIVFLVLIIVGAVGLQLSGGEH